MSKNTFYTVLSEDSGYLKFNGYCGTKQKITLDVYASDAKFLNNYNDALDLKELCYNEFPFEHFYIKTYAY